MMESVYKYLKDPGWWFTAFFVAILASIIAGFAKDYLEKRFGVFLTWSRSRREELRQERARLIAAWSASETLLAVALLQLLYAAVFFVGISIMVVVYISYLRLRYRLAGIEGAMGLPWRTALTLALVFLAFFFIGFRTMVMLSRAVDALNAFCKKRELPPWPRL